MKDLGQFTEKIIFPGVEKILDERIGRIDERMDGFDERMDRFDERMGGFDKRMDRMENRMGSMKDEIINEVSKRTIQSNDEVITKLDILLKDNAAHAMSHHRIDDTLHGHDKRIKKLEEAPHH